MRIVGLDPGTATTGFACIDIEKNHTTIVDYGCITTSKRSPLPARLLELSQDFEQIIQSLKPDVVAIEKIFFAKNVKTGIEVAHARGVLLNTASKYNLKIYEYSPNQVKITIAGDGHADKYQIQKMVQLICTMDNPPQPDDAADALAIALCHSQQVNFEMFTQT